MRVPPHQLASHGRLIAFQWRNLPQGAVANAEIVEGPHAANAVRVSLGKLIIPMTADEAMHAVRDIHLAAAPHEAELHAFAGDLAVMAIVAALGGGPSDYAPNGALSVQATIQ